MTYLIFLYLALIYLILGFMIALFSAIKAEQYFLSAESQSPEMSWRDFGMAYLKAEAEKMILMFLWPMSYFVDHGHIVPFAGNCVTSKKYKFLYILLISFFWPVKLLWSLTFLTGLISFRILFSAIGLSRVV